MASLTWTGPPIVIQNQARHDVRVIAVSGVVAEPGTVTFRVPDPEGLLTGVRLRTDGRVTADVGFRRVRDGGSDWELAIGQPPLHRMEYLLELRHRDGGTQTVPDPGNPKRVDGAFGPKSVVEFGSYAAPRWLTEPAQPGTKTSFDIAVPALDQPVSVLIWSPADAPDDEPLPLLVVHDGPEYDKLAALTTYLSAGVTGQWLPRLRTALLAPGPRDRWYSASASYARGLCQSVIPALTSRLNVSARIGMGASLGALAMLHAHCRYPGTFDALFLQSGSFFSPSYDSRERRFPYYRRIVRFVAGVQAGGLPGRVIPVAMTCGAIEENLHNNSRMAQALRARGYPVSLDELPDMHNYTAWRDALDPDLTRLLRLVTQ
jgi:enterochelin esterase-like enzyme